MMHVKAQTTRSVSEGFAAKRRSISRVLQPSRRLTRSGRRILDRLHREGLDMGVLECVEGLIRERSKYLAVC